MHAFPSEYKGASSICTLETCVCMHKMCLSTWACSCLHKYTTNTHAATYRTWGRKMKRWGSMCVEWWRIAPSFDEQLYYWRVPMHRRKMKWRLSETVHRIWYFMVEYVSTCVCVCMYICRVRIWWSCGPTHWVGGHLRKKYKICKYFLCESILWNDWRMYESLQNINAVHVTCRIDVMLHVLD